jgi:hypothetical protein
VSAPLGGENDMALERDAKNKPYLGEAQWF